MRGWVFTVHTRSKLGGDWRIKLLLKKLREALRTGVFSKNYK